MYHPFLKTFLAVADSGSFLKASKELFLSPPAIMKQMKFVPILPREGQDVDPKTVDGGIYKK